MFFGKEKENSYLYVILPYFNYCKYNRRTKLFIEFVERISKIKSIRIVVSEASYQQEDFQLPPKIPGTFMHFGLRVKDQLWIKENLINIAISKLPKDWKYVAWIDADITFMNNDWYKQVIEKLNTDSDVLQLFQTCVNLGPNGESMKVDKSLAYLHNDGKYVKSNKYSFQHPGYAWAMSRKAYEQMGGLIDFGILGSGDRHMALALIGDVKSSHPGNISENYKNKLKEFEDKCAGLRLGYVEGSIMHHWHGRIEDRKYQERWHILTKGKYVPDEDIQKDKNGVIHLTESGKRLEQQIQEYFIGRKEDNLELESDTKKKDSDEYQKERNDKKDKKDKNEERKLKHNDDKEVKDVKRKLGKLHI